VVHPFAGHYVSDRAYSLGEQPATRVNAVVNAVADW
jgi:hypothetical protein